MGDGKKGGCGCGPSGGQPTKPGNAPVYAAPAPSRRAGVLFGVDSQDNPLQPTATGHTLPFSSNGVFRLPRHVIDETTGYEAAPRPSQGMGQLPNAVLAEAGRSNDSIDADHRRNNAATLYGRDVSPPAAARANFLSEAQKAQIRQRIEELKSRRPS